MERLAETEEGTMGYRKKMIWLPVLLMLLACVMPAVPVKAEGTNSLWMRAHIEDGSYVANICVDTTVTDGMIEVRYDSTLISFTEVVVDSQYVAAHAVNAEEPGVVKIAWVAPGDYDLDGTVHILMQVRFVNTESFTVVELAGEAHGPDGTQIPITELIFTVVPAMNDAQNYKAEDYTAESFAVLENAIANAEVIMRDLYTTQADMDAAAAAITAAIEGLVPAPVVVPTEPTEPTQPATQPTEPATKPTEPAPTNPVGSDPVDDEGDLTWVAILGGLVATGMAALAILRNKKKEVRK